MNKRRSYSLFALILVVYFVLSALPASALTLRSIGELASESNIIAKAPSGVAEKSTTKLKPPKSLNLKVGEVKRVPLNLKYKIAPDPMQFAMDRDDRLLPVIHNNNLFVLGLDTGVTRLTLISGIKFAETIVTTSPMPVTGIELAGDLLRLSQFQTINLIEAVIPITAANQVKWKSDRPKVVKVTAKGVLQCKKFGNAVVTCRTKKGNKLVGSILVLVE